MAFPEPLGEKLYAEVKNFLENHVQSLYEVDMKWYNTYVFIYPRPKAKLSWETVVMLVLILRNKLI